MELTRLIDALPALVWTTLADGRAEFINRRWCDYCGLTTEQATGFDWQSAIHPDDRREALDRWQALLESGQPGDLVTRLRRHDGAYRRFLVSAAPVRDGSGQILKWCGINTDIEDQLQAEEALRLRETHFRSIFDGLPAMVTLLRPDGSLDLANRHTLEFFGAPTKELEQRWHGASYHPDDHQLVMEAWQQAQRTDAPYEFEARQCRHDGTYRWMRVRGLPLHDDRGQIVTWYCLQTDIDDLRRAYIHLTEAQTLSKTGSFTWDVQADHHSWSAEIHRIFGFDPAAKVTLGMILAAIHPEDKAGAEAVIGRAAVGEDFELVFRIVTPAGVKYAHVVGHRNRQIPDRPEFLGALQDVTESKLAEQALNRARTELAHVSRAMTLGTLTASMAHEVNQPLSGIITNATTCLRMLSADPPNLNGARATAQRTLRDGNRASEVINRLRTLFSRKQPKEEPVDLNDAAREVLALSSNELQRSRVVLRTDFQQELPTVTGDRVQLQQVILNLVLNAAEAMTDVDDRPRDLVVATAQQAPSQVRLWVRDCGVGIDPNDSEKLFQTFYTTKSQGMGVGLSISRSIIESHGGRLSVMANGDGPGATFTFSVPSQTASTVQSAGVRN